LQNSCDKTNFFKLIKAMTPIMPTKNGDFSDSDSSNSSMSNYENDFQQNQIYEPTLLDVFESFKIASSKGLKVCFDNS